MNAYAPLRVPILPPGRAAIRTHLSLVTRFKGASKSIALMTFP